MSLTLYCYRPGHEGHAVTGVTTGVVKALEQTFGMTPFGLYRKDLAVLRAMSVAEGRKHNAYEDLVQAVDKHDEIHVTWGYTSPRERNQGGR